MIEYIRGSIAELSPTLAVLDANGVGYGLSISLNTFTAIQGLSGDVKLYVYESIREDAYQLWGFATKVERELFLLLTSVSGVGGQSARVILSSMTPRERRHQPWRRAPAEVREGRGRQDGAAHHRGAEGQDCGLGHRCGGRSRWTRRRTCGNGN